MRVSSGVVVVIIKHVQSVFHRHNPIFLNANLYKSDKINIVERDENTSKNSKKDIKGVDFLT